MEHDVAAEAIRSSEQLVARAVGIAKKGRKWRVAVAAAQDGDVIQAVTEAANNGFVEPVLVGDQKAISQLAAKRDIDLSGLDIVDEKDAEGAVHEAVRLASTGEADVVMKGFVPTSDLLRVVLDKQYRLRGKNTLSHCAVLDIPGYHKLLNLTDGGVVVKPDRRQKYEILENAVLVGRAMGLSPVKVAVSGAYEKPSENLPHSYSDIDFIIPEAMEKLTDIAIQGPLPFDLATSPTAAAAQNVGGLVAGDADVYLVDSIEECNIVAKSLIHFAQAVFAGVIVGAKVPVSLVSRTDTARNKIASLALACVIADYYARTNLWREG